MNDGAKVEVEMTFPGQNCHLGQGKADDYPSLIAKKRVNLSYGMGKSERGYWTVDIFTGLPDGMETLQNRGNWIRGGPGR